MSREPARRVIIKRAEWDKWQRDARRAQRVRAALGVAFIGLLCSAAALMTWRVMEWLIGSWSSGARL